MRKSTKLLVLALGFLAGIAVPGCKQQTATQPLAPGYNNSADQTMGISLRAARVTYQTAACEVKGQNYSEATDSCIVDPNVSALTLTPTVKQAYQALGVALTAADQVYLAYHAGTATETQAQAAVTTASQQATALQSQITAVK